MNISEVRVKLSSEDIISIINDFLDIKELEIKSVTLNNNITVEGTVTFKAIKADFSVVASIIKCLDNKIYVRIDKAKIFKLGIFRMLRSLILSKVSKLCGDYGINNDKETAVIDVDKLLSTVPYVNINLDNVYINKDILYVHGKSIEISLQGTLLKKQDEEDEEEEQDEEEIDFSSIKKNRDKYSEGRDKVKKSIPEKFKKYSEYILVLPDIVSLIYRLFKDSRVPTKTKIVIGASIAYLTVPTDLLPDSIPFIGRIDDVAIIFFLLNKIINDVDLEVIIENWEGNNDILIALNKCVEFLNGFTRAENVEKIYDVINQLCKL